MRVFREFKRRNVHRMAALYLGSAWLIMQVIDLLIDRGPMPESLGPLSLTVLAIGFPVALLLAWFLEVTPEGIKVDADTDVDRPATGFTGRRVDFVIIAVLCAAVLLLAYDKWWRPAAEDSIAVLAFENMSGDPSQEYLSDGLSEEILDLLAGITPLKVIARTSSFSFKGKNVDISTIAEQLNVRHVLEGSIRRHGDRIRVTAQLIDAADSTHLWSETYDRDMTAENLFQVQGDIARAITDKLRVTLTDSVETTLAKDPTKNTEAYTAYLMGHEQMRDRGRDMPKLALAAGHFARAIELDPEYAAAYAGLAAACLGYASASEGHILAACPAKESDDYKEELVSLTRKALELDDSLGEAWIIHAFMLTPADMKAHIPSARLEEINRAYERGLELSPSSSTGYRNYANFLYRLARYYSPSASPEEQLKSTEEWYQDWQRGLWQSVVRKGLEVDPLSVDLHECASWYPMFAASPEEAMRHAQRIVEIAPGSALGYSELGEGSWFYEGRADLAIAWTHKAASIEPQSPGHQRRLGLYYAALGDYEMALAYFARWKSKMGAGRGRLTQEHWADEAITLLLANRRDEAIPMLEGLQSMPVWSASHIPLQVLAGLDLQAGQAQKALERYKTYTPQCFEEHDVAADGKCPIYDIARVLQELGDEAWGRQVLGEWWDHGGSLMDHYWSSADLSSWNVFHRAGYLTVMGTYDEALDHIERLVRRGGRGRALWRYFAYHDIRLDAIRDDPRFQAALATIEADMARQLENVREMERRGEIPSLEELRQAESAQADPTAIEPIRPVARKTN